MISFFRVSAHGNSRIGKKQKTEKPHFQDTKDDDNHGASKHAGKPNGDYAESFARF